MKVTIRKSPMSYPPGQWGPRWHYQPVFEGREDDKRRGSEHLDPGGSYWYGQNSVVELTKTLRRVFGKEAEIVQEWDGKVR